MFFISVNATSPLCTSTQGETEIPISWSYHFSFSLPLQPIRSSLLLEPQRNSLLAKSPSLHSLFSPTYPSCCSQLYLYKALTQIPLWFLLSARSRWNTIVWHSGPTSRTFFLTKSALLPTMSLCPFLCSHVFFNCIKFPDVKIYDWIFFMLFYHPEMSTTPALLIKVLHII